MIGGMSGAEVVVGMGGAEAAVGGITHIGNVGTMDKMKRYLSAVMNQILRLDSSWWMQMTKSL